MSTDYHTPRCFRWWRFVEEAMALVMDHPYLHKTVFRDGEVIISAELIGDDEYRIEIKLK